MSEEKNLDVEGKAKEAKEKLDQVAEGAREKAKEAAEKAKEEVKTVKAEIPEAKAKVESAAAQAGEKAKDAAAQAGEKAKDTAKNVEGKVKGAADQAKAAAKKPDKKLVIGIAAAVCVVAAIAFFALSNGGEKIYGVSDFDEFVKLGKYKGLEYTETEVKVTNKEVKQEIDTRLSAKATTEDSKKGTVKDGDNVNITYVGKIDGKEFEGGSAENYTLTIGSGSFIDGFEDGLIGKKVGEKVVLDLTFPKNYQNKDVAGKDVEFTVTINSRQVTKTPKYDTAFIKANSDYDNKEDYEASVKKDLIKTKTETAKQTAEQTVWSAAVENAEIKKYPKGAVKEEQEKIIDQYKQMAESYNMKWDEFLKTYMQSNEKDFKKQAKTYGETVAKQKLVLYAIADKENLKVTDKEYKERLKELLKGANMTEDQFKEQYNMTIEKYAEENDFRSQFMMEEVYEFLYKNAKSVKAKEDK